MLSRQIEGTAGTRWSARGGCWQPLRGRYQAPTTSSFSRRGAGRGLAGGLKFGGGRTTGCLASQLRNRFPVRHMLRRPLVMNRPLSEAGRSTPALMKRRSSAYFIVMPLV